MPTLPTQANELGSVVDGVDNILAAPENDKRRYIEQLSMGTHWDPPQSGEWTTGLYNGTTRSESPPFLAIGADYLYAVPCILPRAGTYDAIAVRSVVQDAGKFVRLGIYANSSGNPGNLIVDAGEASVGTAGLQIISFAPVQALGPQFGWLVAVTDSAVATFQMARLETSYCLGQYVSGGIPKALRYVWRNFTYGPLPDPFGTPNRDYDNEALHVFLRGA